MPRIDLIELRIGQATDWQATNPILGAGEPGVEVETGKMKIGDGTRPWNDLPYTAADGAPGPEGAPGIVLQPEPPSDTDVLWGDTDEVATAGIPGPVGPVGPPGNGVPAGGTVGQTVVKASSTEGDTVWQSKPVFDVRDYGAIGNNSTDCTAGIQAACDAAHAAGGTMVGLGSGTWRISGPITVPHGVSLWGVGASWGTLGGGTYPLTTLLCTTATAKIIVEGSGGLFGNFGIDGGTIADGPLLHRRTTSAKRNFQSIFLARSKVEAWRIDEAQNDVWIDIHINEHAGTGLILDKGAGGLAFYGCEFARCANWHLIIDETTGTGPYSAPSHNTWDHCLFEVNPTGVATIPGCIRIKTGKRNVFRDCAMNPVSAVSDSLIHIDGSGLGADPIVVFDGCWIASTTAGLTGIVQDAGTLVLMGATEFGGLLNAWRFNGDTANVLGPITYTGVTNRWDAAGTGDIRANVLNTSYRPLQIRPESTDLYVLRSTIPGEAMPRLDITPQGEMWWSDGAAARDVRLYRWFAGALRTDAKFAVGGELQALGAINHDGSTVGFYGATPIVRPTVNAAATDATSTQNLVNSIRTALVNLGLAQ